MKENDPAAFPIEPASVPLWFWNHRLEIPILLAQLQDYKTKGFRGVCIHPRAGLKTDYFGAEWWEAVEAVVKEAASLGLKVWIYDEMHFPSGLANGKVTAKHPEYRMKVIRLQHVETVKGPGTHQLRPLEAGWVTGLRRTGKIEQGLNCEIVDLTENAKDGGKWEAPEGEWLLSYFVLETLGATAFGFLPNYLSAKATERFVELTHREYMERLAPYIGNTVEAVFTDEPSSNYCLKDRTSVPYTEELEPLIEQIGGKSLAFYLTVHHHEVGPKTAAYRCDLFRALRTLYTRSYFGVIQEACRARGLASTGHVNSDGEFAAQVWQHYDVMEVNRYFDYPGVDVLFSHTWPNRPGNLTLFEPTNNIVGPKMASSSAHLLEKKGCMSEAFGAADAWGLTPFTLKRLTDWQLSLGINLFSPHGVYYSVDGVRKYEWIPSHSHEPYWDEYADFNAYLSAMASFLRASRHVADVLMVTPNRTVWNRLTPDGNERLRHIEACFESVSMLLLQNQIDYDYIQEELLAGAELSERRIIIRNKQGERIENYSMLLLPACEIVMSSTVNFIEQCVDAGVPVVLLDSVPWGTEETGADPVLASRLQKLCDAGAITFAEVPSPWEDQTNAQRLAERLKERLDAPVRIRYGSVSDEGSILVTHWVYDEQDVYFIVNTLERAVAQAELHLPQQGVVVRMDWAEDRMQQVSVRSRTALQETIIPLSLAPAESFLLIFQKSSGEYAAVVEPDSLYWNAADTIPLKNWTIKPAQENVAVLRDWSYTVGHKHTGLRYLDVRRYRALFRLEGEISSIVLGMEQLTGVNNVAVFVNGNEISFESWQQGTRLDPYIREVDITPFLRTGSNEIEIEVVNDGVVEQGYFIGPGYLYGDFRVNLTNGELCLSAALPTLAIGDWREQGYPHYSGTMVYETDVNMDEERLASQAVGLRLPESTVCSTVSINGVRVRTVQWAPYEVNVRPWLVAGRNTIRLEVRNTAESLFLAHGAPSGLESEPQLLL